MNNALKQGFPLFMNEESLRSAIELVCADFGKVVNLKILPPTRNPDLYCCACFLRLDSAEAEAALKSKLEVVDFFGDLCFFADVDNNWTNRTG